ncbi:MAG: hypothetical protein J0M02_17140, partial [Planctomycetes bacterium]|nr:hypothetical protein [Planctomycetota bacterium]
MDPASPERYNRGARFAAVAAVLRASLDGRDVLYAPADHDAIADHGGLASEFDLCIPGGPRELLPPGWLEAPEGGGFLKIGVGILRKQGRDYHLFHQPQILVAAQTAVAWRDDGARFVQTLPATDGWAYRLEVDLALRAPEMRMDWRLANTGTRAFTTRTYVHNFIRFGDHDVGPGYELSFPGPIAVTGATAAQTVLERAIRFDARIPTWVNLEIAQQGAAGGSVCTVAHAGAGMSLLCSTSLPCERVAVHARAAYLSPEQFVRIELAPGAEASWTRSWRIEAR